VILTGFDSIILTVMPFYKSRHYPKCNKEILNEPTSGSFINITLPFVGDPGPGTIFYSSLINSL
jgi:hypothetical protein